MPSFDRDRFRVVKPDSSRTLPIPAEPRWVYAHHPMRWEVHDIDGVARWVPLLQAVPILPGANGVRSNGDDRDMLFALQRNGWTIIENGGPAGVYADECIARGGTVWLNRWSTPHEYAPGRVKIRRTDEQREAFIRWCANLVDVGALPEPDPVLLEEVCERYEDIHIRRLLSRELEPTIARKLEKERAELERMRGASLRAPEPAEKPKRRRAAAAQGDE